MENQSSAGGGVGGVGGDFAGVGEAFVRGGGEVGEAAAVGSEQQVAAHPGVGRGFDAVDHGEAFESGDVLARGVDQRRPLRCQPVRRWRGTGRVRYRDRVGRCGAALGHVGVMSPIRTEDGRVADPVVRLALDAVDHGAAADGAAAADALGEVADAAPVEAEADRAGHDAVVRPALLTVDHHHRGGRARCCGAQGHVGKAPAVRAEGEGVVEDVLVGLALHAVDYRPSLPRRADHVGEALPVGTQREAQSVHLVRRVVPVLLIPIEYDERAAAGRRRIGESPPVPAEAGPGDRVVGLALDVVQDNKFAPAGARDVRQPLAVNAEGERALGDGVVPFPLRPVGHDQRFTFLPGHDRDALAVGAEGD